MTGNDPFASPATASGIDWKALSNALLLITVNSVKEGIKTAFGDNDAVSADVVVLDGPAQGDEYNDTLIFPKVLQSQLRPRVGQKVLGRLGQGQAKPGQSAPWLLQEATDADKQVGLAWLNRTAIQQPAASSPPAGAPPF